MKVLLWLLLLGVVAAALTYGYRWVRDLQGLDSAGDELPDFPIDDRMSDRWVSGLPDRDVRWRW